MKCPVTGKQLLLSFVLSATIGAAKLHAALSVTLVPSIPPPAPLGTIVHWNASVSNAGEGNLWYRFRARGSGSDFHVIVDYGPNSALDWTTIDREGSYQIEVVAWNKNTGETAGAIASFEMTSLVGASNTPAITTTANPLVFLYSAPACAAGSRMRVQMESLDGTVQRTAFKACSPDATVNFYLAGMRAGSDFIVHHTVDDGLSLVDGPMLTLTTPSIPVRGPVVTIIRAAPSPSPYGVLLHSTLLSLPIATDLVGNVIWFYDAPLSFLTAPLPDGYFLGIVESPATDPANQLVREFDLAGTTLKETNAARVSEQLVAMGMHGINAFHHEARLLPDGRYLVLAESERFLSDVQGPGPVDVIGDTIVVLDSELQVVWAWDAFDHLDTQSLAILGETCQTFAGCPPYYLASNANDWLHGNSLRLTPDGNILYSARSQDLVIKINYNNGSGNGDVIWRLGQGGDFQIVSIDPWPWFSHQHDAALEQTGDGLILTLFDDGNVRQAMDDSANSRGQVLLVDEKNRIATLILSVDMGAYAYALGSAQRLPNGNFHFDVGWITADPLGGRNTSRSVEVDPSGDVVYAVQISTPEYRTFRMQDLYTP